MNNNAYLLFLYFLFLSLGVNSQFSNVENIVLPPQAQNNKKFISIDLDNDLDYEVVSLSSEGFFQSNALIQIAEYSSFSYIPRQNFIIDSAEYTHVDAADINGDNLPDIVAYCESKQQFVYFENAGNCEVGNENTLFSNVSPITSFILADFDNDNLIDIVYFESTQLKVRKNLGNFTFGTPSIIDNSSLLIFQLEYSDMNNDGLKDICFVKGFNDAVFLLENLGNLNFQAQLIISNQQVSNLKLLDMNSDGNKDIITSTLNGTSWTENLGNGAFGPNHQIHPSDLSDLKATFGDLDADGDIDYFYSINYPGTESSIYCTINDGFGNFSGNQLIIDEFNELAQLESNDLNHDGFYDLIYRTDGSSYNTQKIEFILNSASGSSPITNVLGHKNISLHPYIKMDVDGNGFDDIVGCLELKPNSTINKLVWFKNLGNGKYSGENVLLVCNDTRQLESIDLDIDGDYDILGIDDVTGKIIWCENVGNSSFNPPVVLATSFFNIENYALGDVDNDGDFDVVYKTYGDVFYRPNNGNGTLGNAQTISGNVSAIGKNLRLKDIDNDGDLDLSFLSGASSTTVGISINVGGASPFSSAYGLNLGIYNTASFEWLDMDSDGDLDVLISSTNQAYKKFWVENICNFYCLNPTASQINIINSNCTANDPYQIVDLNLDGLIDIAYNNDTNFIAQYNLGSGLFGPTFEIFNEPLSVLFIDSDQDSDFDLVFYSLNSFINSANNLRKMSNTQIDANSFKGLVFYDNNQNGIKETNESSISMLPVQLIGANLSASSDPFGHYNMNLLGIPFGSQAVEPILSSNWVVTSAPSPYVFNYAQSYSPIDSVDFGIYPTSLIDEVEVDITNGMAKCDNLSKYWVNVRNTGTTIASGVVKITLDNSVQFVSSMTVPDSVVGQNIYWHYDSLYYFSELSFEAIVNMPGVSSMGDTLHTDAEASILNNLGTQLFSVSDSAFQVVTCAYDPNDKQVLPKGDSIPGYIPLSTNDLEFTIRFQNTGNDTATNVVIKDYLDYNLDWTTLTMISSSHNYIYELKPNGVLVVSFMNIHLPDSGANFMGSQGYVKFKLDIISGIAEGDQIKNTGRIYFDENPAIITNTTLNTIKEPIDYTSLFEIGESKLLKIYPNPFDGKIQFSSKVFYDDAQRISIMDVQGKSVFEIVAEKMEVQTLDLSHLEAGIYLVEIKNNSIQGEKLTFKIVKY